MQETVKFFNYTITTSIPEVFSTDKQLVINTLNPHSYVVAKNNKPFHQALLASDILFPDGFGVVWAIRILQGIKVKRITGSDLHNELLNYANTQKLKVFYLGSTAETLALLQHNINQRYPNIQLKTFSPPFKDTFTTADQIAILQAVNNFNPTILFVGMTAPKQEIWVQAYKSKINAQLICSVGAVFDFIAETVARPSVFFQKIGLEWFIRFLKEPKRLWRRIFISLPIFIADVYTAKLKSYLKR